MRAHGTKARYVFGATGQDRSKGCRCDACREAVRLYERNRMRQVIYGRWEPFVDATEVRQHMRNLERIGVGKRAVHLAAGVSISSLDKIRSGRVRKVRPATASAILAVTGLDRMGGSRVPADETWRRVDVLLLAGYRKGTIASWLGQRGPGLQLRREWVSARHARTIAERYERLWREDPSVRIAEDAYVPTEPLSWSPALRCWVQMERAA